MDQTETRFAAVGADRVAYQITGDGPRDLVLTSGLWSHLDVAWEDPAIARALRRMGSWCRLIRFDRRGSGLSDPRPLDGRSVVDHWIEDLRTVLDTAESQEAIIVSCIDSGPLVLKFAERHPRACSGLVFGITTSSMKRAADYPQGHPHEMLDAWLQQLIANWGTEEGAAAFVPAQAGQPNLLRWYAKYMRAMASPRTVADNMAFIATVDARHVLPAIRVPTLVLARREQKFFTAAQARYVADHIPGAVYHELGGANLNLFWDGAEEILQLIEEFVTGRRGGIAPERTLATLLFTDIVDSTKRATKLGDAAWRELLDAHDRIVREEIERYGGRLVDSAGDGTLAMFATPASAIDCAHALHAELKNLKLKIRTGLHIGEIELREDGRVGGIAVHIGARVLGLAHPGDVLVSRTVRDVLIGGRYKFRERGIHQLKGVPSRWPLYVADPLKTD